MKKQNEFAYFIIFFLIASMIVLAALSLRSFKNMEKTGGVTNLSNPSQNGAWNIPDLPSGFDWESRILDENDTRNYQMFWYSTVDGSLYGDIPFSTTIYFTDLRYDDPDEILDYEDFTYKLGKDMAERGWNYETYYDDKRIIGLAADGVFSSI